MIELYGKIAWLTIIMWSFYPVVWLFSEGFASFSVSFEVLCPARYCVLLELVSPAARKLKACVQQSSCAFVQQDRISSSVPASLCTQSFPMANFRFFFTFPCLSLPLGTRHTHVHDTSTPLGTRQTHVHTPHTHARTHVVWIGCRVHDPRHHQQGCLLLHDRVGARFARLLHGPAGPEPRVRLSSSACGHRWGDCLLQRRL